MDIYYIDIAHEHCVKPQHRTFFPIMSIKRLKYLCEEMLDDRGQSLYSFVSLDEQPPQLVDSLVLLLCLLFTLILFGQNCCVCHHSCCCARLGSILQTRSCFGAGS